MVLQDTISRKETATERVEARARFPLYQVTRLFISFSGGETSGFMAQWLKRHAAELGYTEVRTLFANTGQEREETLVFANRCDEAFGLDLEWIEAEVHPGERRSPTGRVVDFATASRDGRPFRDVVAKYGVSNRRFPHCTRALKLDPMVNHLRATGWAAGSYDTAIGIRADEIDRMSVTAVEKRIVYPLIRHRPMTKPKVNFWWSQQPFRLGLKGYEGNCAWCWKKTDRKLYTLAKERPEIFEFPAEMEARYGRVGPEFEREADDYRRVFFRKSRTTADILREAATRDFEPASDDSVIYDPELDVGSGCEESCEVFADEDDPQYNLLDWADNQSSDERDRVSQYGLCE